MTNIPIEEQLGFDVSPALQGIGQIDDALQQVVQGFSVGLSSALETLTGLGADVPSIAESLDVAGLGPAVDAALADASAVVPIEGDTSGVTEAIDAATDVAATVPVDADVSAAAAEIAGLEGETVQVSVEADTSAALDDIQTLGDTAGGATGNVLDLGAATQGFTAAAALGRGEASGLGAGIGLLGTTAGALAGGFAAGAATVGVFFSQAIDAQAAVQRLDESMGPLAERIENLQVGDLNADLSELALSLGSDDDALRNIAATFFNFQRGAGTAQLEASKFSETVLALSARAVALNPALGSIESVAGRLGNVLGRGGRFASQFGLDLSSVDIKARAAQNAAIGLGDGISFASLQLAGAQLALEQYGDHLEEDIARGTENPIIQLRALRQEFEEATEAIGAPLVAPIFDILTDIEPVAEQVAEVLGKLAEVTLPLLAATAPLLEPLNTTLELTADGLGAVATVIEAIPGPVLSVAAGLATLAVVLPPVVSGLSAMAAAGALSLGPGGWVLLGVGALAALGATVGLFGDETSQATVDTTGLATAFTVTTDAAGSLDATLQSTTGTVDAYIRKQLELKTAGVSGTEILNKFGVSFSDLDSALTGPTDQLEAFIANMRLSKDPTDDEREAVIQFSQVIFDSRQQLEANAKASLEASVAAGTLTQAQVDAALAAAGASENFGVDYVTALRTLAPAQRAAEQATIAQRLATGELQQAFLDLKPAIADGSLTAEDAQGVADRLGISLDDAKAAVDSLSSAMDSFVSTGLAALPSAGAAVETFASGIEAAEGRVAAAVGGTAEEAQKANDALVAAFDPQRLIDAQNEQIFAIASFQNSIETLIQRGQENAAAQLIAQGPGGGGAEAALALVNDETKARAFDNGVATAAQVRDGYRQFLSDPVVKAQLSDTLVTLADGSVVNALPILEENAKKGGEAVVRGFESGVPDRSDKLRRFEANSGFGKFDPDLAAPSRDAAVQAGQDAQEGFTEGFQPDATAAAQVGKIPVAISANIQPAITASNIAALQVTLGFASGLAFDDAATQALSFLAGALTPDDDTRAAAAAAGYSLGLAFASGFAGGLTGGSSGVSGAAGALASVADDAVRRRLGIDSPSKAGIDIGVQYVAGIAQGLADLSPVQQATAALTLALVPDLQPALRQTPQLSSGIVAASPGAVRAGASSNPALDASAQPRLVKADITLNKTDPDPKHFADELAWLLQ